MQYLLLIYGQESDWFNLTPTQSAAMQQEYGQFSKEIAESGKHLGSNRLTPVASATTVRVRDGKRVVTDGPFAETKEQLAGYYVLDCEDLNQAIQWAARIPTSCGGARGSIEIRELGEFPNVPESILKPHRVPVTSAAD